MNSIVSAASSSFGFPLLHRDQLKQRIDLHELNASRIEISFPAAFSPMSAPSRRRWTDRDTSSDWQESRRCAAISPKSTPHVSTPIPASSPANRPTFSSARSSAPPIAPADSTAIYPAFSRWDSKNDASPPATAFRRPACPESPARSPPRDQTPGNVMPPYLSPVSQSTDFSVYTILPCPRPRVKILTVVCRPEDAAAAAAQAGADAVGIIFDPTSRRCVSADDAD